MALTLARAVASQPTRAGYLSLRRQIAEVAELWRIVAASSAEVLLGPPRGEESVGALGKIDAAFDETDGSGPRTVAAQLAQVTAALQLAGMQLRKEGPSLRALAQAMSDAAFAAGGRALGAWPGTPSQDDAVRADVAGTLDGVAVLADEVVRRATGAAAEARTDGGAAKVVGGAAKAGGGAAKADGGAAKADGGAAKADGGVADGGAGELAARRAQVGDLLAELRVRDPLVDRAQLALDSGRLGVAVRRVARAAGVVIAPPLRPARLGGASADDEPISVLTVPAPRLPADAARAALGRDLFFDRRLSRDAARACAGCHRPERAFSDGLPVPTPLVGSAAIARNTPTLLYAPLQAAQLWDGRVITPELQALAVLHAPAEMGLDDAGLVRAVAADPALQARFAALFSDGVTVANLGRALAAYEAQALIPAGAPIDRFARGEEAALSAEARAGLDVFCGRARCARCHVPPLFAGVRPPDFSATIYSVLGVPADPAAPALALDGDLGRGRFSRRAQDMRSFKTPTLRNVAATAPYFHHGRYATLEAALDFYDRGGGRGLGLAVPNQDPDIVPLHLTALEKRRLLAFLRGALSDESVLRPPRRR